MKTALNDEIDNLVYLIDIFMAVTFVYEIQQFHCDISIKIMQGFPTCLFQDQIFHQNLSPDVLFENLRSIEDKFG